LAQEDYDYVVLEGGGFAGRCNIKLYEQDGSRVSGTESIRYMVVYFLSQLDDESSIIMSGNWTAGNISPFGALVMGWKSIYGPYYDKEAYVTENCTSCNVTPDYFWLTWGTQGDYTSGWFGWPTRPYVCLSGYGVSVDWDEEELTSIGTISLRGRMRLSRDGDDVVPNRYIPQTMIQAIGTDEGDVAVPHWNAYSGGSRLYWEPDGPDCWDNILGEYDFICEFFYEIFGIDLCGLEE
jgi:hypothetical protein